jgi:hypothetical protein
MELEGISDDFSIGEDEPEISADEGLRVRVSRERRYETDEEQEEQVRTPKQEEYVRKRERLTKSGVLQTLQYLAFPSSSWSCSLMRSRCL